MNLSLLKHLVSLIEEIFKADAPVIEKAAVAGAVASAEQDPKVQAITDASVALLAAAQNLKQAVNVPESDQKNASPAD